MHKDDLFPRSENQIWAARKFRGVQSIPVSQTVHEPAKCQFWTGILRVDCSHDGGALSSRDMVRHTLWSPNERPLIVDVLFGRIAQNPGGRDFFLSRKSFDTSINVGWKTDGSSNRAGFLARGTPYRFGSVYHNSPLDFVQHITAQRSRTL
jgi:hypothetical protein